MKCNSCGSEWKTSVSGGDAADVCPFCKAPLKPAASSLKETLKFVVQSKGIEVFQKSGIINSYVADLVLDDEKGKRNVKTALAAGAGTEFYNIIKKQGTLDEIGQKQFLYTLTDCGFAADFCSFIAEVFAYSVGCEIAAPESKADTAKKGSTAGGKKTAKKESAAVKTDNNTTKQAPKKSGSTASKTKSKSSAAAPTEVKDGPCVQNNKDGSITTGTKANGEWNGKFKTTYSNGSYYEGTYDNGKIVGQLTFADSEGRITVGTWQNGNWNGPCRSTDVDGSVTEGNRECGVWNGAYTKTYKSGAVYKGTLVKGVISGDLTYTDSKGTTQVGTWQNGNWNGPCKCTDKNGTTTEGVMVNGVWSGAVTQTYKNGNTYKGNMVNGVIQGKVYYTDKYSNEFSCNFINGAFNGAGECKTGQGVVTGKWVNGKPEGNHVYNYNDGKVYEGGINIRFEREGRGIIKFPHSDARLEATFKNDKPVGDAVIYFSEGDTYTGEWNNTITGIGTFNSKKSSSGFKEITYSGTWKDNLPSGKGELIVTPILGFTLVYKGNFNMGTISGNGCVYSCKRNSTSTENKEPLFSGHWTGNYIDAALKNKSLKNTEKLLSVAIEYIKNKTDMLREE